MSTWMLLIGALVLLGYAVYELVIRPASPRYGAAPGRSPLNSAGAAVTEGTRSVGRLAIPVGLRAALVANATTMIVAMGVVVVVAWMVLYGWYSLPDHYTTQYFAFDKIPGHFDSPVLRVTTLLFLLISLCYGATYWLMKNIPAIPRNVKIAVVVALACVTLVNVFLYPVGALDVYNYIIELKLTFFYHQNPYITTFHNYTADPAAKFAFWPDVPLFYGPLWLFICWLPTSIVGFADAQHVLLSLKALNVVLLVLTALAIYRYQDDDKRGWIAAYLFVGNPMVLFECIGNAHNDIIMAVFVIAAVLYFKRRSLLSVPLLMLSVLVKFFSASLFPLVVLGMLLKRWAKERLALAGLLALVPLVLTPLPFWAGGKMLSGLAAGTQVAQSLNSASLFSLLREYLRQGNIAPGTETLVQNAFLVLFALCALIVMWLVWRGRPLESGLTDTFLLFAVLVSLLTPWYLIPALALIALRHNRVELGYLFAATTLGLVYHPLSVWAWFNSGLSVFQIHLFQGACLTGPILGLFLVEIGRNVTQRGRRTAVAAA